MRPRRATLAVALTLVAGCAPTRIPVSELSGFGELNERVGGKTVQVVLVDGAVIYARNIHVYEDSLCWGSRWIGETASGRWTGERASTPTADVKAIKVHKTARGTLKGLLYGGGFGLLLATATYSPGWLADVEFVMKTALGALIGIVAWATTDEDVYEFIPRTAAERASGGRHRP